MKNVDMHWAQNTQFMMYEFSCRMRRDASLAASIRFKGGRHVAEVNKLIHDKKLLKDLQYAAENPGSEVCKQLEKKFLPLIRQTGRNMSFHPEERKSAPMHLYNMVHHYCAQSALYDNFVQDTVVLLLM